MHGSVDLAQTLIENDLIDEYRLVVFPVLLGSGQRLFNNKSIPSEMQLVRSRTTSKGVVFNVYRPAGKLKTGNVVLEKSEADLSDGRAGVSRRAKGAAGSPFLPGFLGRRFRRSMLLDTRRSSSCGMCLTQS